ncbi:hypothetical protein FRC08_012610 [Ceratobasidium sp. 394]|nr:hypothetical protein FRC08_012610 [Ceratobasidium sp. 394]
MGWDSNMTDTDLDNLLSLLVAERQSLFELFRLMPNTQGWSLLFLVLWVKLAPECDSDNQRAMSPLKRLYQLNDLLGRYCLAATNDKTLNIVYTISRWMSYRLLPLMGKPGFFPTPTDQAELPSMKKVAIRRLKSPPTPWRIMNTFEGDPTSADLLSILLEFITSYQTFSFRPLDDTDLLLSDAVFARLWVEAQSDRALAGLVGRQNADKLAYAAFRNASFTILGIQDNEKNPTGLRRASAIYSAGLQRAGLVDLIGRILLMPILPRAFGTTLIATQDNETTLRYLDPSWFHMVGYIDRVPGLLQDYYEQAVKCFDQDYATWLKVLRFLQVQDRSTPYCKRYFEQCQDTWEKLGKHARFLTKTTRRCAHTGCINSIFLHTVPLLCCSECLGIYYCSKRCQTQAWEIQDPGSHRLGCGGVSEIWEILSHEHRVIALQSLEGWHMGMINGNF